MITEFYKNKVNRLFFILGGFFITNALIAEFVGVKIFSLERTLGFSPFNWKILGVDGLGFNLTAGVVLWPVVFVMTDIINEYFGEKGVKRLSNMAVIFILYAFLMVYMTIHLSPNEWWQNESGMLSANGPGVADMDLAFKKVFGQGLWIIGGSMVAFLVGQIVDVFVFHKIKKITGEKKIWLRATGSTLVSQFIDSFVVLIIAFYIGSDWELVRVLAIGLVNYIYKFVIAVLMTPVIYLVHDLIERYLGEELSQQLKTEAAEY
jgi:uncharacterized integral membrane protein (TIGR00697 family)